MAKGSNIVHQYFRKEFEGYTILVKLNPIQLKATEITISKGEQPEFRDIEVDEDIMEDLKADGFMEASPLEFNLYLSGLI
jgi:hypothetical protein